MGNGGSGGIVSYDIRLIDAVSGETIQLPFEHMMKGGMCHARVREDGGLEAAATREAWLNITYNYARYYYEATDKDSRFAHDSVSAVYADGTVGPMVTKYGIRGIYGKSGAESIGMLEDMIERIEGKYRKDGEWIESNRDGINYYDKDGNIVDDADAMWAAIHGEEIRSEKFIERVSEGPNEDYWKATAGNALRPLYQLKAMAQLRPDGIWSGD